MAITDAHGLPIGVCVASASPHEVNLVEQTLDALFVDEALVKPIGDKAFDSNSADEQLEKQCCVELVAPHRANRRKPPTQDGRPLRRYRRRWKVERLFAWLHNFRRLVVRYEVYPLNFLTFVQLDCLIILMRHF